MLRVVICEDKPNRQRNIGNAIEGWMKIAKHQDVTYSCCRSCEDFLEQWENGLSVDLLFLASQNTDELAAMALAQKIRSKDQNMSIVLIVRFANEAFDGYGVKALCCIKNPVQEEDIYRCMGLAYQQYDQLLQVGMVVKARKQEFVIRYADMICGEMQSHYLQLFLSSCAEVPQVRTQLTKFMARLPQGCFVQCNRSCIVNLTHVHSLEGTAVTLSNNRKLTVSQMYLDAFQKAFHRHCINENEKNTPRSVKAAALPPMKQAYILHPMRRVSLALWWRGYVVLAILNA